MNDPYLRRSRQKKTLTSSVQVDFELLSTYDCAALNYVLLMKANVTLKIDADLLREAKILAAENGTSISALLAARLEQTVRERRVYERARKRALIRLREGMNLNWTPPASRDELHER